MTKPVPDFEVRLAAGAEDVRAAQRLRYQVFVEELGGDGPLVDHQARLEIDRFDAYQEHLLLIDHAVPEGPAVVGSYRLMTETGARRAGAYYSEGEYELEPLRASGRRLLELGRTCLDPAYRGGGAMYHLWRGLADYVGDNEVEVLFGVASFHGTDTAALAQPLSHLHYHHRAPDGLRVRARGPHAVGMDLLPPHLIDRRAALLQTPALIKAYLRLGGMVGEGAWVDHAFNTTDVCLVMDTARMNPRQVSLYAEGERA